MKSAWVTNWCSADTDFKEKQTKAVPYIRIQAWESQYWITPELLWCFCMQHMIYYCTFCCTISASEDNTLLEKTLPNKLKLLLILFFYLSTTSATMKLINLQAISYLELLETRHYIIVRQSPIHSAIYTRKQAHGTRLRKLLRHTILHPFV